MQHRKRKSDSFTHMQGAISPNREPLLLSSSNRRLKNDELFLGGLLNKGTETSLKLRVMSAVTREDF